MKLTDKLHHRILQATGAEAIAAVEVIQPLWSQFGYLYRVKLNGGAYQSVVLKHIQLAKAQRSDHPRGWATDRGFQRKLRSYQVECHWYRHYAAGQTPGFIDSECSEQEIMLLMEDLASCGYPTITDSPTKQQIQACLDWLAEFHAKHLGSSSQGLWPTGGYWHLQTRPEELAVMSDKRLQAAAPAIDNQLRQCAYQTLIHGDGKLANFCFSRDSSQAAAVDFQYVGGGVGISDVMLFISSAVSPELCQAQQGWLLDYYFARLHQAIKHYQPAADPSAVERSWRALYPMAWADFVRFAQGWSPSHWKINPYSLALTEQALCQLGL